MRSFAQMIQNLRSSESALYDALVETVGYIHFMYHAKNRKMDGASRPYWPQLVSAIQTKWVAERIAKLEPKGKRVEGIETEEQAMLMVAPEISRILNERKQENAAAQIKRNKAKAEKLEAERKARVEAYTQAQAPKMTTVDVHADFVLASKGECVELSAEEFEFLKAALAQLRQPKMLRKAA